MHRSNNYFAAAFRPRYWHARFMLVCMVGSMLAATAWEPDALVHQVIARAGHHGWFWVGLLMALIVIAMVDIVANDLLPDRYEIHVLKRRRYFGYMALCGGLLSLSTVIQRANGWGSVLLVYLLPAFFMAHIAVTDLYHHHYLRSRDESEVD